MTGVISGIKRMATHDGDGLRTTVFFKGCPLKCIWCHNPESIAFEKQIAFFRENCAGCGTCKGQRTIDAAKNCPVNALMEYGTEYEVSDLTELLKQDKPFFDASGGGVTLSGGECLAQSAFAIALAEALQQAGISVYVDTCGFVKREVLEQIIPFTAKFLYDIKAMDSNVHKSCTGQENGRILENLRFLTEQGCDVEIRYPLVMGYNDGESHKIGAFLQGLQGISKVKVLQYHSFSASRYDALGMKNTMPQTTTTVQDVENAVNILKSYGLRAINAAKED